MASLFRYRHHSSVASVIIRQLERSRNNISLCCLPPLLSLQFNLLTKDQYWYRPPHERAQFQYGQIHVKSLLLKLDPSVYMSYDNFYSVMQENLENWGEEFENNYRHNIIHDMIGKVSKIVDNESNKRRFVVKVIVGVALAIDHYRDTEIFSEELSSFNAMVPASTSSMLHLLKRIGIDVGDNIPNDDCVICFEKLRQGRELLCMPCSHMFHPDCITTWLKSGHSCPICRYDLLAN
ncbi:PREDICTED: E3 ubiquitin-protein ligase SGR9, amyloplastic-like [Nicotiana attenuata]|uniref:RING-type E3 ubiquitin transferase n=1 Tax=Nicotiana attenuata TaxID=49451 RepID=A0A314L3M2_NICAT|nr:PREDICTED: E3 ubiquitin-protein ligase SGR9, amyloplastic-like [Nicotiana attenuata]OIT36210.1 e3 ubiquitin-protein ligase sgr9, amyloplastic [Nicotiana attenuata]